MKLSLHINQPAAMNRPASQRRPRRAAATVLEVLFATLVIVVGLIGIASIIPVASRHALEANTHSNALSLGLAWSDSFIARGLYRPNPALSQGQFRWIYFDNTWNRFTDAGSGQRSICIDPYSFAISTIPPNAPPAQLQHFPYFEPDYNPVLNSSGLPGQPRMIRASLEPILPSISGTPVPMRKPLIDNIFGSVDDLVVETYVNPALPVAERNSLPAQRLFGSGRALTEGRYTWMATVVPNELGGDLRKSALVSFVVMHRHDHTLNVSGLPSPRGERLTSVTPLSGNFVGGAGGRVRLSAYQEISDSLAVGDWMLLGRKFGSIDFFRWYRVIATSGDASYGGGIWSRDVVLEGPDFEFDLNVPPNVPTFGVLVGGVVTVIERQVKLKET